jgi:hypothetical protein
MSNLSALPELDLYSEMLIFVLNFALFIPIPTERNLGSGSPAVKNQDHQGKPG